MAAVRHDKLILPANLRHQLLTEARATFPRECCGLIEGVQKDDQIEAVRLHPARNLATRPDRFEIDPMEQFRLLRALRPTDREIVGCYHSHPNGRATPSEHDRDGAGEEGFIWLIASLADDGATDVGAFLFSESDFRPINLEVR